MQIGDLTDIQDLDIRTAVLEMVKSKDFAKLFFANLVDWFSPDLRQLILPHVDIGPQISLNVPAGATLSASYDGRNISMTVYFNLAEDSHEEMENFLKSMDKHPKIVQSVFNNTIQKELSKLNQRQQ